MRQGDKESTCTHLIGGMEGISTIFFSAWVLRASHSYTVHRGKERKGGREGGREAEEGRDGGRGEGGRERGKGREGRRQRDREEGGKVRQIGYL